MLDKEYAVNMLTALVDSAEEMNEHGIKAKCLAVNDAVFDTIRGLITYLLNSEEVVRCKYCTHCDCSIDGMGFFYCDFDEGRTVSPNGFCDVAERRKETEDATN